MTPETLHLKGFAGIRAGLKCDEFTLDLERLAGDAQLIALAGPNGTGKSSVMDNLQPYRLLPSRASSFSPAGFSFYDHLVLPECMKELTWRHEGRRYRSTLVFRMNGKRKAEAYLHVEQGGQWVPVRLADGTLSDGKAETYDACLASLLGNPETFFTSVFAAQNRRPLAAYTPGEIKGLMVELLGLERIRQAGEKASQVVRLLKNTLEERRRALSAFGDIEASIQAATQGLRRCEQEMEIALAAKRAAQQEVEGAQQRLAMLNAERNAGAQTEQRRAALAARLIETREAVAKSIAALVQDRAREEARIKKAEHDLAETRALADRRRSGIARTREEARGALLQKPAIEAAIARFPAIEPEVLRLGAALEAAQAKHQVREGHARALAVARAHAEGLRQQAGDAALRAEGLKQRFGLTDEVPCRGSELQPRCKLLAHAHEAHVLLPCAEGEVARIRQDFDATSARIRALEHTIQDLGDTAAMLKAAQAAMNALTEHRRQVEARAAMAPGLKQAEQRIAECDAAQEEIRAALQAAELRQAREVQDARQAIETIAGRVREQERQGAQALQDIERELAALPPAFDAGLLSHAQQALQAAGRRAEEAESSMARLVREEAGLTQALADARAKSSQAGAARAGAGHIEAELGWWALLAKALGTDGVIALCVDDAGPELSRLANELLLACYGPRFSVSLRTQVETAKKELREGFDVLVFDADSGQSRSVTVLSGGEKIWINESLTRAIALYLARASGRRYETLFCDEADGPLDMERKRMFMQMKREVLRLGGYRREIFVSQTPELTQMADVVIDLGAQAGRLASRAGEECAGIRM